LKDSLSDLRIRAEPKEKDRKAVSVKAYFGAGAANNKSVEGAALRKKGHSRKEPL